MPRPLPRVPTLAVTLTALVLSGCGAGERLQNIGRAPELSPMADPTGSPGYRPVALPMPLEQPHVQSANSLWRPGARAFFKDQRASNVGDILTILIEINDRAQLSNATKRSRSSSEDFGMTGLLGLEQPAQLGKILPEGTDPEGLVGLKGDGASSGTGNINRNEVVQLKIAAIVSQILPNGNMVVTGRQEVRVNHEVRELLVSGIIRPEDIGNTNSISYEKIAEARISYGGRGLISDVQQPRYGQQFLDIVLPW